MSSSVNTVYDSGRQANLADIMFAMSVNFLLYVLLIIVFYMLVRFYLEEETHTAHGYSALPTEEEEEDLDKELPSESSPSLAPPIVPATAAATATATATAAPSATASNQASSSSFLNISEFNEPEGTKQEVIQRLIFCAAGLIISFTIWGLVQERMLTQTYGGDYFVYSYGLVFMNRLGGLLFSTYLMHHFSINWQPAVLWEYSFPSVANMLSSWCQYEALAYVSFPIVMLAKACKMIPIMLMGVFMNNKSYETYEYVSGAAVAFGIYLFLNSSEKLDLFENVFGDPENVTGATCGVVLLVFFLVFDSFTGQWQTRMFEHNPSLSPLQMMLIMNAFSAVFSFITLIHQEELTGALGFVYNHPEMIVHLVIFIVCSTVGQLFIFYTVKNFGAVVFSIIMSIRILSSVLLSCLVYSHPVSELGVLGILIVFGATAYRLSKKAEGKPLLRWKDSERSGSIFKEWHEHLDI